MKKNVSDLKSNVCVLSRSRTLVSCLQVSQRTFFYQAYSIYQTFSVGIKRKLFKVVLIYLFTEVYFTFLPIINYEASRDYYLFTT